MQIYVTAIYNLSASEVKGVSVQGIDRKSSRCVRREEESNSAKRGDEGRMFLWSKEGHTTRVRAGHLSRPLRIMNH